MSASAIIPLHGLPVPGLRAMLLCLGIVLLPPGTAGICSDVPGPRSAADPKARANVVTDIDGNTYGTVRIGAQVWMTQNLRVTRYRDGTVIPNVSNDDAWSSARTGAYCLPEYDSLAADGGYGLLYNFRAVSDRRGLCPEGWHVPTAEEWRALIGYLGGDKVAGGKMKDTASGLWRIPVRGAGNGSGFSAVPAGGRGQFGGASDAGYYATWWSSTRHDSAYAWHWGLYPDNNGIRSNPGHTSSGFSVRCIQDR